MEGAVNILGSLTAFLCAWLLYRGYRRSSARLLFWGSVCFLTLGLENSILFVDKFIVPDQNLGPLRYSIAIIGIGCLIYGLIQEL